MRTIIDAYGPVVYVADLAGFLHESLWCRTALLNMRDVGKSSVMVGEDESSFSFAVREAVNSIGVDLDIELHP